VWEGYTKTPPQPGADCEGLKTTYSTTIFTISRFKCKEILNMLGTAAEGEEIQVGDGPQLLYILETGSKKG
jgi:hypothetical protein